MQNSKFMVGQQECVGQKIQLIPRKFGKILGSYIKKYNLVKQVNYQKLRAQQGKKMNKNRIAHNKNKISAKNSLVLCQHKLKYCKCQYHILF